MTTPPTSFVFDGKTASRRYIKQVSHQLSRLDFSDEHIQRILQCNSSQDDPVPFTRLLHTFERCRRFSQRPLFFIETGCQIQPADYGPLGMMAMTADTLLHAMQATYQYQQLMSDALITTLLLEQEQLISRLGSNQDDAEQIADYAELDLSSLLSLCRFLVGDINYQGHIEVHFRHAPRAAIKRYEDLLNARVLFHQSYNQIVAPQAILALPVYGKDSEIHTQLSRNIRKQVRISQQPSSCRDSVFQYLINQQAPLPKLDQCAEYLQISSSTLKRRLKQDNCSYQQLSDSARYQLARNQLQHSNEDILSIAMALGYSDRSSFEKAFKRWTGISPAAYRKQAI